MSEELLKIADGLLAVSEGVRALAGKAHSCNCSKNQEEERGQKDEESGNEFLIGSLAESLLSLFFILISFRFRRVYLNI